MDEMTIEEAREDVRIYIEQYTLWANQTMFGRNGSHSPDSCNYDYAQGFIKGWESRQEEIDELVERKKASLEILGKKLGEIDRLKAAIKKKDEEIKKWEGYHTDQDCSAVIFKDKEIKKLREALRKILSRMDDGTLVRDISRDQEEGWHLRMIEFVKELSDAKEALKEGEESK